MSPAIQAKEFRSRHYDFGRGVVGGVSDFGRATRWLRQSDNLVGRPHGAMGSVRDGYHEPQASYFADEPTTLGKLVPGLGSTNRLLVHTKNTAIPGGGLAWSITPGVNGATALTPPFTLSDADCVMRQLNATLFVAQQGTSNPPMMYLLDGGVYRLDSCVLRPPTGFTPTTALAVYTGGVSVGRHWYRLRYRYRNGTSKVQAAASAFPAGGLNVTGTNEQVDLGNLLGDATAQAAQDWIGWTLERTTLSTVTLLQYSGTLGADALPDARAQWFWVAEGTTATYSDKFPDADLFFRIDDGIYGSPLHMDGLVAYRQRLFGWYGSTLFVSQAVGDAFGSGPCNWDAELAYQIGDDADTIQAVITQGDRLLVIKTRSVHPFEGIDPEDFRTYAIPQTGGAVGPRAVTTHGSEVYMLGETGMLRVSGNTVEPWGQIEVGHYLADMNAAPAVRAKAKMVTVAGEYISLAYPSANSSYNDQEIIYDLQVKEFRHFTKRRIRDALVQEDNSVDFGGATLLTLDPVATAPPSTSIATNPSFVAWVDAGGVGQTRAQKVDSLGTTQWDPAGILIGAAIVSSDSCDICPDGSTGCIVGFIEDRLFGLGVFVQRLDSSGSKLWGSSGITIDAGSGDHRYVRVIADGSGGAFIAYLDLTVSPNRIKLTRVDSSGAVVAGWPVTISTASLADAPLPKMIVDPFSGDLLLGWWHLVGASYSLFVQRYSGAGVAAWTAGGVNLGADAGANVTISQPPVVADNAGGVIAFLAPTTSSLVGKRVIAAGTVSWTSANLAAGLTFFFAGYAATRDGAGGATVFFINGAGAAKTVQAARVNASGAIQWGPTQLQGAGTKDVLIAALEDGVGGAIVAWGHDPAAGTAYDLYAQRVSVGGGALWGGGTPLTIVAAANSQSRHRVATDGANGILVYWDDLRGTRAIYGQRLEGAIGTAQWAANGVAIATSKANLTSGMGAVFTSTPEGLTPSAGAAVYRIWAHPFGSEDEVLADGTGGLAIPTRSVTPFYDEGEPDTIKELIRLQLDVAGDDIQIDVTLTVMPGDGAPERLISAPLTIRSEGTIIGDETGAIGPTDAQVANEDGSPTGITGLDVVGGESTLRPFTGLGGGVFGTRYSLDIRADATGGYQLNGFTLDGNATPRRAYS